MKIITIFLILFVLISCRNGNSNQADSSSTLNQILVDSIETNFVELHNKNNEVTDSIDLKNLKINSLEPILVKTSLPDSSSCKKWKITVNMFNKILPYTKPIDDVVWFKMYDRHTCAYQGTLSYNGKSYNYTINAASWVTIGNDSGSVVLGCNKEECSKFFLTEAWNPKE